MRLICCLGLFLAILPGVFGAASTTAPASCKAILDLDTCVNATFGANHCCFYGDGFCDVCTTIYAGEAQSLTWLLNAYNASSMLVNSINTTWCPNGLGSTTPAIICDGGGRITNLNLANLGLKGALNWICVFVNQALHLSTVDIQQNQLTGVVPSCLTNSSLTELRVERNLLSGTFPNFTASTTLFSDVSTCIFVSNDSDDGNCFSSGCDTNGLLLLSTNCEMSYGYDMATMGETSGVNKCNFTKGATVTACPAATPDATEPSIPPFSDPATIPPTDHPFSPTPYPTSPPSPSPPTTSGPPTLHPTALGKTFKPTLKPSPTKPSTPTKPSGTPTSPGTPSSTPTKSIGSKAVALDALVLVGVVLGVMCLF